MPDDLSPVVLAVTHLMAAGVGALVAYLVTMQATRGGGVTADEPGKSRWVTPSYRSRHMTARDYVSVVVLTASLFVVAIGVLAWLGERSDQKQRECFAANVSALTAAAEERARASRLLEDAQARLDAAQTARDHALDSIVLVVIGTRTTPPTAGDSDFTQALTRFANARSRLVTVERDVVEVRDTVKKIRRANPIPPAVQEACQ